MDSLFYWGYAWYLCVPALVALAILAGYSARMQTNFAVVVLMIPALFIGNWRHGRPIDWILGTFLEPRALPILLYVLAENLSLVVLGAWILVEVGSRAWSRRNSSTIHASHFGIRASNLSADGYHAPD